MLHISCIGRRNIRDAYYRRNPSFHCRHRRILTSKAFRGRFYGVRLQAVNHRQMSYIQPSHAFPVQYRCRHFRICTALFRAVRKAQKIRVYRSGCFRQHRPNLYLPYKDAVIFHRYRHASDSHPQNNRPANAIPVFQAPLKRLQHHNAYRFC